MSLNDISRSKAGMGKKIKKIKNANERTLQPPTSKAAAVKPAANRTKALVAIRLGPGGELGHKQLLLILVAISSL